MCSTNLDTGPPPFDILPKKDINKKLSKYVHSFIKGLKYDHLLKVSGQKLSMSLKYTNKGPPILDTLIITLSTQNFPRIFLRLIQHQG